MDALVEIDVSWDDGVCICILHLEEARAMPPRPTDNRKLNISGPHFQIAPSGESGLGMFTSPSRTYSTGGLIWQERPTVIIPTELIEGVFDRVWEKLPEDGRGSVMELRNAHPSTVDPFEGRLRTNFIGIELPPTTDTSYRGLFPVISRANHSCSPNATYYFNYKLFALELRAARQIGPNEEIHIQYIDVLQPREERKRLLRELYMFDCQCPSCDLPAGSNEAQESDRRRQLIGTWAETHTSLKRWLDDALVEDDVIERESLELLGILLGEGLEAIQRYALDMLCASFAARAELEEFIEWAKRAREAARMGGDDHPMVIHYDTVLEDPESSQLWGARSEVWEDLESNANEAKADAVLGVELCGSKELVHQMFAVSLPARLPRLSPTPFPAQLPKQAALQMNLNSGPDDFVDRVLDVINCEPVETDHFLRSIFTHFGDIEFIVRWSSAAQKHHAFLGFRHPESVAAVVPKQLSQAITRGWRLSRLNPDLRERVASMVPPGTDTSPGNHPLPSNASNEAIASPRLNNQDRNRSHSRSQQPLNGWPHGPHPDGRSGPRPNWDRDPRGGGFPSPIDVPHFGRPMPPPSDFDLYDVGPVMSGPPPEMDPHRHSEQRIRRFERLRRSPSPIPWGGPATPEWDIGRPPSPRLRGRNRSPHRHTVRPLPGPPHSRPPFAHDPRDHGLHVSEKGPMPGPFPFSPDDRNWSRRPQSPPPRWMGPGPGPVLGIGIGGPKRARSMSRERVPHGTRYHRTSDVRMSVEKDKNRKHQRGPSHNVHRPPYNSIPQSPVLRGRSVSPVGHRGIWPPPSEVRVERSADQRHPPSVKGALARVSSPAPLSTPGDSILTIPARGSISSESTVPAVAPVPTPSVVTETAIDLMLSADFVLPPHPATLTERMKQENSPMEAYMGLAHEYIKHDLNNAEWVAMTGIECASPIKPLLFLMAHLQTMRAKRLPPNSQQANACLTKAAEWISKAQALEGDDGVPAGCGEGLEWFRKFIDANKPKAVSSMPSGVVATTGPDTVTEPDATPPAGANDDPSNSMALVLRNGGLAAANAASEQLTIRLAEAQTAHQHVLSQLKAEQAARARLQERVNQLEQLLRASEAKAAGNELTRGRPSSQNETESDRTEREKTQLLAIISEERMAKRKAEDAEQEERAIRRKLEDQLWVLGGTTVDLA